VTPVGAGRQFYKMTGSGNDFVFFDVRSEPAGALETVEGIRELCAPGTGIGADGIVFLSNDPAADFRIRYYNRDGSLASLCGNASLCSARLARELGIASGEGDFRFESDDGMIRARIREGIPEIDLQPIRELDPAFLESLHDGEQRIGFARVGVPHLVLLVDDVDQVDVLGRGRPLRSHPALTDGANVNFVSPDPSGAWRIRTYERGVEDETLACGTGTVAAAALLAAWGLGAAETSLVTRSGRPLTVRFATREGATIPSLGGEGRIVFRGELPSDG
jgi:diaminopimelate epimerase